MEMISCSFIACRPNRFKFGFDEEDDLCIQLKFVLVKQIEELYNSGVNQFLIGCRLGVDMWVGEIVVELMKLHQSMQLFCIIPHEEQAAKWSPFYRNRYYSILEKSTYNILISPQFTDDCYFLCNRYLIDHSHLLVSVSDPSDKNKSNVKATVEYAQHKDRGVIFISPDTARVTPINVVI